MCFATHTYTDMERCETCWKLETASTKLNLKVVEQFFLLPSRLALATNGRAFEELTCGPRKDREGKKNERMPARNTFVTDFMTFSLHAFMVMMMATMGRRRGTMERGVWGAHKQHRSIPR